MLDHREFWNRTYTQGYLDALYDFAHWKDGTMYVGTTGRTFKEVKSEIEAKCLALNTDICEDCGATFLLDEECSCKDGTY